MTTLAITPNWKSKSAKFKGTVAAGEHVSVTILNEDGEGGEFIDDASPLRLRVVNPCNGRTLAIFPEPVPEGETPEEWDSDLSPLRCTLNLNTVQMLKAVPPAANVPLLWVLDDYDNNTLYFKEQFEVTHWPRLRGEEEPTDLDNYKDIIADFNTRLDGYDSRITGAENAAQAATENASAAAATANQAVGIANQALDKAETAQNSAAASAEAAAVAQVAAEAAQVAAEEAAESINSPDATLSEEGVAADAKAAGDAIAAEKTRATAAEAAEETRAKGVESGLRTDLTAAQKAIDDEAILRAAADADLEANKADKATTYTKSEIDAKWAGFVDGAEYDSEEKKIILTHGEETIAEIDATDFIKDGMVSSVKIEDGKLVITFNTDAGLEPIEIPLTDIFDPANYYDKMAADGKFVAKEAGKGLSTEDYTTAEKTKLGGIAAGAQVNVIETVKVNGTALTPQDKAVNIPVPTLDDTVTRTSANGVKSSGIWSAIWGALTRIPFSFTSMYDWVKSCFVGPAAIAPKFNPQGTYNIGDVRIEVDVDGASGLLYRCKKGYTTTSFSNYPSADPEHWEEIDVNTLLAGKASTADATLTVIADGWEYTDDGVSIGLVPISEISYGWAPVSDGTRIGTAKGDIFSSVLHWEADEWDGGFAFTAFRTGVQKGYVLGSQTYMALASEAEAEALRTGKADRAPSPTAGNLAALDANGNPVDSDIPAANVALKADLRYALTTKSIDNGAVTLDDRAINAVAVSSSLASLTVNFPAATSGKARDFGVRLTVASGITTAPQLVLPQGVTCENADGTAPEIGADGAATILYFTETAAGVFLVKGEVVTAIL